MDRCSWACAAGRRRREIAVLSVTGGNLVPADLQSDNLAILIADIQSSNVSADEMDARERVSRREPVCTFPVFSLVKIALAWFAFVGDWSMLPASKSDFPKCLYLDQNKWIDLSRAHYGKPGGEAFVNALRVLRSAVDAERLLIPFSLVNTIETIKCEKPESRERLARFMVDLSRNCTLLPYMEVCASEIRKALTERVDREEARIRASVVDRGFPHALGLGFHIAGPPLQANATMQHLLSPKATVDFLLHVGQKREGIEQGRAAELRLQNAFGNARSRLAGGSDLEKRHSMFKDLLSENGLHGAHMAAAAKQVGTNAAHFLTPVRSPEEVVKFGEDIPCLNVYVTLTLARDREFMRPIHENDLRDLTWLAVALPYANLVVAEKYWSHQANATGLDKKYETSLHTDLRKLPEQLAAAGCVP
jgi:hypothetical protein